MKKIFILGLLIVVLVFGFIYMYMNSVRTAIGGVVQSSVKKCKLESGDTENVRVCVENKGVMPSEADANAMEDIDTSNIKLTDGFVTPTHGEVTATAWYYPSDFGGGWHPGIDIANNTGTKIVAPADGIVIRSGYEGGSGYGNMAATVHESKDGKGYSFIYGHMSKLIKRTGSKVKQGEVIGLMGTTGNSSGPHLHFEVFVHKNRTINDLVKRYKRTGDYYFGLGYNSKASDTVYRVAPQYFLGVKYGQVF